MIKKNPSSPLVSVCCITYNQAHYIEKALQGFLMQKTNFSFEIIVHDDASTDQTAEKIEALASRNQGLIFPRYQTENQYSKGIPVFAEFNFKQARGKYLALCEGDDYWTDQTKLQWQVDFLEQNPDVAMCTHEVFLNIDTDKGVRSLRKKLAVLLRHFSLYGINAAAKIAISSAIGKSAIESFDLTHRSSIRKKSGEIYSLDDLSNGATHMSTCSMVVRKSVIDSFLDAFYVTPRGAHQLLLLMAAISGGIAHFHKIAAVKNDQPTSVTQCDKRRALNRRLGASRETNERLKRYHYFLTKDLSRADKAIFEEMVKAEEKKIDRLKMSNRE